MAARLLSAVVAAKHEKKRAQLHSDTTESLIKPVMWGAVGVILEEMMAREGFFFFFYQWEFVLSQTKHPVLQEWDIVCIFHFEWQVSMIRWNL